MELRNIHDNLILKISVAIVLSIFVIFFIYISFNSNSQNISFFGQFGDSFGVLNSLFTGLGFAGLVTTIYIQQNQLRQQAIENSKREAETQSLFQLEIIMDAYHEAENLLADGNNNRAIWIRAGRLLKHAKQLEPNLLKNHKIRLEIKQLRIRSFFSELLGSKQSHFFYGVKKELADNLDAAIEISGEYKVIDGVNCSPLFDIIPDESIKAVWEAGEWPQEYDDPLGENFTEGEKESLKIRYLKVFQYFNHRDDFREKRRRNFAKQHAKD